MKRDETGRFRPHKEEKDMTTRERDDNRTRRAPMRDRDGEQGGNDPSMAPPIRLRDVRDGENLGDYSQSAGVGVSAFAKKVELENHGDANYQGPFKPMAGEENLLEGDEEMDAEELGQNGNKDKGVD